MTRITKDQLLSLHEVWKAGYDVMPSHTKFLVLLEDLYDFRIKKRTRDNSLSGSAHIEYTSVGRRNKKKFRENFPDELVDGQTKWDQLVKSLTERGWLEDKPLILRISKRNSKPKIRDGHHRLFAALEVGLKTCPIELWFEK